MIQKQLLEKGFAFIDNKATCRGFVAGNWKIASFAMTVYLGEVFELCYVLK